MNEKKVENPPVTIRLPRKAFLIFGLVLISAISFLTIRGNYYKWKAGKIPEIEYVEIEPEVILLSDIPLNESRITNKIKELSIKYYIDEAVIYTIIFSESSWNVLAKSSKNCRGLMQISKFALIDFNRAHSTNYSIDDLYDPILNIEIGVWYYSYLIKQYDIERYDYAYIAYVYGPINYLNELNKYINKRPHQHFKSNYKFYANLASIKE